MEALKIKEMEQKDLERKYGKKKAKEVAEKHFQVCAYRRFKITFVKKFKKGHNLMLMTIKF